MTSTSQSRALEHALACAHKHDPPSGWKSVTNLSPKLSEEWLGEQKAIYSYT